MKLFECGACRQPLYFENTACVSCGHRVGFEPGRLSIVTLEPADAATDTGGPSGALVGSGSGGSGAGGWLVLGDLHGRRWRFCQNASTNSCNWLVDDAASDAFCPACRHNRTVPDLSVSSNIVAWQKLEVAKHYLFYALLSLDLPRPTRLDNPAEGLVFDFLADTVDAAGMLHKAMTGHDSGQIVINIAEADDVERERRRAALGEPYRTLLGHFRHEIGHFYWDRLVRGGPALERFRALFGDERDDYNGALRRHYEQGPPADWQGRFVSAYATTHAWEDWAETWAHYLHIVDTLETAQSFGVTVHPHIAIGADLASEVGINPYRSVPIADLIQDWVPLGFAMNSLARSMGYSDLYPFVLSPAVIDKLGFVNDLVHGKIV